MLLNGNEQSHVLFKLSGKGIPDIIVILMETWSD